MKKKLWNFLKGQQPNHAKRWTNNFWYYCIKSFYLEWFSLVDLIYFLFRFIKYIFFENPSVEMNIIIRPWNFFFYFFYFFFNKLKFLISKFISLICDQFSIEHIEYSIFKIKYLFLPSFYILILFIIETLIEFFNFFLKVSSDFIFYSDTNLSTKNKNKFEGNLISCKWNFVGIGLCTRAMVK